MLASILAIFCHSSLLVLQNPPPCLEDGGEGSEKKKFSRELHELVALCLQKDPTKRPTAKDLLEHKFFKKYAHIQPKAHLQKNLLHNLPNVVTRVAHMKSGVAGICFPESREAGAKSKEEYIKGVSAWNFDVAALKAQVCVHIKWFVVFWVLQSNKLTTHIPPPNEKSEQRWHSAFFSVMAAWACVTSCGWLAHVRQL